MAKSLVIVESPAKAKTINKYLGNKYLVKSSVGHIRDLPTSSAGTTTPKKKVTKATKKSADLSPKEKLSEERRKIFERMAVDPENGWKARYEILPGKEKVLNELKKYADSAETIYLATDLDREGEAIAWHLREAIGGESERYKRVSFSEITKKAIEKAFESPTDIDMDKVYAQQTRRFLDRLVGFMISPVLWAKVARGLSAGRVQSVATRLVYEREKEIHAFIPDEYWEVFAETLYPKNKDIPIKFQVAKHNSNNFEPKNGEQAQKAVDAINASKLIISDRTDKPTQSKPSAPFITSTLQQASSLRLGYGVKKTMMLAQRLYEAGFITYMRTDSTNLSKDAVEACRSYIDKNFGKKYLPKEAITYSNKKNAQEAHEAIRPSDVEVLANKLPTDLDPDAIKLYDLIWRQFVACQMTPAEYQSSSITIDCKGYLLKARGRVLTFDGYIKVQTYLNKDSDDVDLPNIKVGDQLDLLKVDPQQRFTKPPPRFTEASLVKELEKRGIGRPSTYAAIISTIQDRGYVKVQNRRFYCLKMGAIVSERLVECFNDLLDYNFTANMEEKLDSIASGQVKWKELLDSFYKDFSAKVDDAKVNMKVNDPTLTDIKCPTCSREMGIRTGRTGVFLGCSGYNLPVKERCKTTINLIPGEEAATVENLSDDEGDVAEIQALKRCPKCSTAMDHYLIDETRKLHVCGNNPICPGFLIEQGKFKIKGYDGPVIECDKCGSDMQLKTGRFGKYFGCTKYPDCKNTRKLLRSGEAAPPKSDPIHMTELKCEKSEGYFVLRDGAAGIFLASSAFPKSRETKKPKVEDLIRHKSKLDPKYIYLTTAPTADPEGNPAIIRFSRKTKEHYIGSDNEEGKATKWSLTYNGKKWVEDSNLGS